MIAFQDAVPNVAASASPAVNVPLIAAKWTEPTPAPISVGNRTNHKTPAKAIPARRESAPGAVDTKQLDAKLVQPRSIETLLPVNGIELPPDGVAVQTVLVVMQGGEDGSSQISWTVCVWRVTLRGSGNHAPIEGVFPAKST